MGPEDMRIGEREHVRIEIRDRAYDADADMSGDVYPNLLSQLSS
jgi:hypothetical protein